MRIQLHYSFEEIVSQENLLAAWGEFLPGKSKKPDVQRFARHLIENIIELHDDLVKRTYRHGPYKGFAINDPKPRQIHKASVRDRLFHHALYRILYPFFDRTFIADSFSCRINKGTYAAIERFHEMARRVSRNNTRTCWVLKCDIQKFFANIDHEILIAILQRYITDKDILWVLTDVIESFHTELGKGLPLGNLTSQLLVNIYMNEFDQFVKHRLKATSYIRYADDFVFLSKERSLLHGHISAVQDFLHEKLKLYLHPKKVHMQTFASGIDFLGWVHFPHFQTIRTTTKRRMMRKLQESASPETLQSYLGLLGHGNTHKVTQEGLNAYWLSRME